MDSVGVHQLSRRKAELPGVPARWKVCWRALVHLHCANRARRVSSSTLAKTARRSAPRRFVLRQLRPCFDALETQAHRARLFAMTCVPAQGSAVSAGSSLSVLRLRMRSSSNLRHGASKCAYALAQR
jgi:hypothetical protein